MPWPRLSKTVSIPSVRPGRAPSGRDMWLVILGLATYHELTCKEGQLLSEAVDRGLEKHPALVYGFIAITVAHLLNWLPPHIDPYRGSFITLKGK